VTAAQLSDGLPYGIEVVAEVCNRSIRTVARWERSGRLKRIANMPGRPAFLGADVKALFGEEVLRTIRATEHQRSETKAQRAARAKAAMAFF